MEEKKIVDRLANLCARREYCTQDIFNKALKLAEGDVEVATNVVAALEKSSYVSDLRYAEAFSRDKAQLSGWGEVKIRASLRHKGLATNVIDAALGSVDHSKADAKAIKVVEVKYKALKDDPQWRIKLLRFTLGRGYTYEQASLLIRRVTSALESEV